MSERSWVLIACTKALCRFCLSVSLLVAGNASGAPLPLELYIPDAPPLTFVDDSKGHGMVGEAVLMAIANAGYVAHVHVLPWARSQKYVSEKQDLLIAPLSRTPERENRFTWIAPIMPMERAFFSLDRPVSSFAQAKKTYRVIGVGLGSAQEEILRAQGFSDEQIYPLTIGDNPAQMLLKGRLDAWFNGVPESQYIWPKMSERKLFMSPVMSRVELYLACSRLCSAQRVQDLRKAVETLRDDGTLARIQKRYLSP
ncbi:MULTISPECIES: ABC transporter substrate-binding protein [Pseudomonas]|uniref:ABC transporter substrate-binding protein n=1 Tax=Pseudomonas wuhanensis TaxID=2954098 RepID=A0ABY9GZE6_9PSED|nr:MULTISPECIES: ABC transporter substrate-binding protein [unclassified Pseudomonas]WLI15361.1 ABC transporter substrate-binding protein [Pseudomonas sp. FP603]WLI21035.1 ABC transporter substrate-binding protein [Pseudomonas sp. FP607]